MSLPRPGRLHLRRVQADATVSAVGPPQKQGASGVCELLWTVWMIRGSSCDVRAVLRVVGTPVCVAHPWRSARPMMWLVGTVTARCMVDVHYRGSRWYPCA